MRHSKKIVSNGQSQIQKLAQNQSQSSWLWTALSLAGKIIGSFLPGEDNDYSEKPSKRELKLDLLRLERDLTILQMQVLLAQHPQIRFGDLVHAQQ